MRIADFLAGMLEAHTRSLAVLHEALGPAKLGGALETLLGVDQGEGLDEGANTAACTVSLQLVEDSPLPDDPRESVDEDSPYDLLDETVAAVAGEVGLPEELEIFVWSYPHYRAFAESPVLLTAPVERPGTDSALALAEEAMAQAGAWNDRLFALLAEAGESVERLESLRQAAHAPWLRFRTTLLRRKGHKPFKLT